MESVRQIGWSGYENQLCLAGCFDITARDALMQKRREDADKHHHKQIWIKDAHGGPYSKVPPRDKALDDPTELGYERVETGPTTNFVGNHMTQAAIDLVQADLDDIDEGLDDRKHNQPCPPPPELLHATIQSEIAAATIKLIDKYTWNDSGKVIHLEVGVGVPVASVECCFQSESMRLHLVDELKNSHELHLRKLWSKIQKDKCTWKIKGARVLVFLVKKNGQATWAQLVATREERRVRHSAATEARFNKLRKALVKSRRGTLQGSSLDKNAELNVLNSTEVQIGRPSTLSELRTVGDDAYLCGSYVEAIRCYENALNIAGMEHPNDSSEGCNGALILRLAECCWKAGKCPQAVAYCNYVVEHYASTRELTTQALILTAKVHEESENFQEALQCLILANRLNPYLTAPLDNIRRIKQILKAYELEM